MFRLDETINERPELNIKCLPNVKIFNCEVFMEDGQNALYVYKTGKVRYREDLGYINTIDIKGLIIHAANQNINLQLFTNELKTANQVNVNQRNIFVQEVNKNKISSSFLQ